MIDWIAIRHFAITESVELELGNRFTAVTGETGSGKSLMVDALGILLGARADNALIQYGQEQAEIQAAFQLPQSDPLFQWLEEHDLQADGELQLRRVIRRDKPGKGYINGRPVNMSMLRTVGASLVDIHGQHEHHSLMQRQIQQSLLDTAAGNQKLLAEVAQDAARIGSLNKQLEDLNHTRQSIAERIDLLKFQLGELQLLAPVEGEWQQLEVQQKRLQHSQELVDGSRTIADALFESDDHSLHMQINKFSAQLRQLESLDTSLGPIAAMLEESAVNLEEAALQLKSHYDATELDPAEIEEIEARFSSYHSLARKHRVQPDQLAAHTDSLVGELQGLNNPDAEKDRLEKERAGTEQHYRQVAAKLTRRRRAEAKKLGKAITAAMQNLGMEGGQFIIEIRPVADTELPRSGLETVEFMVTANPGLPLQPLAKIASGGEVSRISLAIQVILADSARVPTLVFDEVDVGIGGTVANVVGQRLKELGKSRQVICVTHLAQVAAKADHHYAVTKASENGRGVRVDVTTLDPEQRIEEIARMSGSEKMTAQSRAHAEQLLSSS